MHGHWLNHYLGKNKASGGSGSGGGLVVHDVNGTLDKTYAEIAAAVEAGLVVLKHGVPDGFPESTLIDLLTQYGPDGEGDNRYYVDCGGEYSTDSPEGYPKKSGFN